MQGCLRGPPAHRMTTAATPPQTDTCRSGRLPTSWFGLSLGLAGRGRAFRCGHLPAPGSATCWIAASVAVFKNDARVLQALDARGIAEPDEGELFLVSARHTAAFIHVDGTPWRAILKVSREGAETFLQSLHRVDPERPVRVRQVSRKLDEWRGTVRATNPALARRLESIANASGAGLMLSAVGTDRRASHR